MEPYLKPPRTTLQPWRNPHGTLPQTTTPQPGMLVEPWWNPGGTLVEPWWNPGGTLVEPWWNPGGTLVELWWNLSSGSPRTTPSLSGLRPQSFQLLGNKKKWLEKWSNGFAPVWNSGAEFVMKDGPSTRMRLKHVLQAQ